MKMVKFNWLVLIGLFVMVGGISLTACGDSEDETKSGNSTNNPSDPGPTMKWTPQESYYYAVENTGFQARPFRSEGTYSKYNSIDDNIDNLHYYTTWIKFGIGRASYDASQEIRNKHLTRDDGLALVREFDGETPTRYIGDVMDYLGLGVNDFMKL